MIINNNFSFKSCSMLVSSIDTVLQNKIAANCYVYAYYWKAWELWVSITFKTLSLWRTGGELSMTAGWVRWVRNNTLLSSRPWRKMSLLQSTRVIHSFRYTRIECVCEVGCSTSPTKFWVSESSFLFLMIWLFVNLFWWMTSLFLSVGCKIYLRNVQFRSFPS